MDLAAASRAGSAVTVFEDLSGITAGSSGNPYDALIEASSNDAVCSDLRQVDSAHFNPCLEANTTSVRDSSHGTQRSTENEASRPKLQRCSRRSNTAAAGGS